MMELGCGIQINNKKNAYKVFRKLLTDDNKRKEIGDISTEYVQKNIGATEKIIKEIL